MELYVLSREDGEYSDKSFEVMFASNDISQVIDILICNDLIFNPERIEERIKELWKDCKNDSEALNNIYDYYRSFFTITKILPLDPNRTTLNQCLCNETYKFKYDEKRKKFYFDGDFTSPLLEKWNRLWNEQLVRNNN